jgi:hypothetical protein
MPKAHAIIVTSLPYQHIQLVFCLSLKQFSVEVNNSINLIAAKKTDAHD